MIASSIDIKTLFNSGTSYEMQSFDDPDPMIGRHQTQKMNPSSGIIARKRRENEAAVSSSGMMLTHPCAKCPRGLSGAFG